jgi:hypothetical protein
MRGSRSNMNQELLKRKYVLLHHKPTHNGTRSPLRQTRLLPDSKLGDRVGLVYCGGRTKRWGNSETLLLPYCLQCPRCEHRAFSIG